MEHELALWQFPRGFFSYPRTGSQLNALSVTKYAYSQNHAHIHVFFYWGNWVITLYQFHVYNVMLHFCIPYSVLATKTLGSIPQHTGNPFTLFSLPSSPPSLVATTLFSVSACFCLIWFGHWEYYAKGNKPDRETNTVWSHSYMELKNG